MVPQKVSVVQTRPTPAAQPLLRPSATPMQISSIQFGVMSEKEIAASSYLEVQSRDLYTPPDRIPARGGTLDSRLGAIDKRAVCDTCHNNQTECIGHFGYIKLVLPVFHGGYFKATLRILQMICKGCARVALDEEVCERYINLVRAPKVSSKSHIRGSLLKEVWARARKTKKCPHCGHLNGTVKKVGVMRIVHYPHGNKPAAKRKPDDEDDLVDDDPKKPTGVREEFKGEYDEAVRDQTELRRHIDKAADDLNPERASDLFSRIPDGHVQLLEMNPEVGRPERLLVHYLPVPPLCIRPSVCADPTVGSTEDDLTMKASEIVHINNVIAHAMEQGVTSGNVFENWELLQNEVARYFNSEQPGLPPLQGVKNQPRGISQRLKGKTGRFRGNLSGKRVDFSGRTVISPDPNLRIDQVGVPERVCKILTFPERVTPYNIERLRTAVRNGPDVYPGANFATVPETKKKKGGKPLPKTPGVDEGTTKLFLRYGNRNGIASKLKIGLVVERHLIEGDVVLFNCQRSLHRVSIMAHRVAVSPRRTFRPARDESHGYYSKKRGTTAKDYPPDGGMSHRDKMKGVVVKSDPDTIRDPRATLRRAVESTSKDGRDMICEPLLHLSFVLIDECVIVRSPAISTSSQDSRESEAELGANLSAMLFAAHQSLRSEIVGHLPSRIVLREKSSPLAVHILSLLAERSPSDLLGFSGKIKESAADLVSLSPWTACPLIKAYQPLFRVRPDMQDEMFLALRKALIHRDPSARAVTGTGFLAVIAPTSSRIVGVGSGSSAFPTVMSASALEDAIQPLRQSLTHPPAIRTLLCKEVRKLACSIHAGPGPMAGGPNYIQQLGKHTQSSVGEEVEWTAEAKASDAKLWASFFSREIDWAGMSAEANAHRYRSARVAIRVGTDARPHEIERVKAAIRTCQLSESGVIWFYASVGSEFGFAKRHLSLGIARVCVIGQVDEDSCEEKDRYRFTAADGIRLIICEAQYTVLYFVLTENSIETVDQSVTYFGRLSPAVAGTQVESPPPDAASTSCPPIKLGGGPSPVGTGEEADDSAFVRVVFQIPSFDMLVSRQWDVSQKSREVPPVGVSDLSGSVGVTSLSRVLADTRVSNLGMSPMSASVGPGEKLLCALDAIIAAAINAIKADEKNDVADDEQHVLAFRPTDDDVPRALPLGVVHKSRSGTTSDANEVLRVLVALAERPIVRTVLGEADARRLDERGGAMVMRAAYDRQRGHQPSGVLHDDHRRERTKSRRGIKQREKLREGRAARTADHDSEERLGSDGRRCEFGARLVDADVVAVGAGTARLDSGILPTELVRRKG